jgi:hypothetical protein
MIKDVRQPTYEPFRARLTESGLSVEDSSVLCLEYTHTGGDWSEIRRRALQENLLGKGSQARTDKLLRAVERRVLNASPPLNRPLAVAQFLGGDVPAAAKVQLLFVLAVAEDVALAAAYRELVVPLLNGAAREAPSKPEILQFLERVAQTRPEVGRWKGPTRTRWAEGFRLVLREAGLLTGGLGKGEVLQAPVIRAETVSLLCHAIADSGLSGWVVLRHELLRLLLLTDADAVRAARMLQDRGWWTFSQNDALVEFRRNHRSLEEWLDHVLGR